MQPGWFQRPGVVFGPLARWRSDPATSPGKATGLIGRVSRRRPFPSRQARRGGVLAHPPTRNGQSFVHGSSPKEPVSFQPLENETDPEPNSTRIPDPGNRLESHGLQQRGEQVLFLLMVPGVNQMARKPNSH